MVAKCHSGSSRLFLMELWSLPLALFMVSNKRKHDPSTRCGRLPQGNARSRRFFRFTRLKPRLSSIFGTQPLPKLIQRLDLPSLTSSQEPLFSNLRRSSTGEPHRTALSDQISRRATSNHLADDLIVRSINPFTLLYVR